MRGGWPQNVFAFMITLGRYLRHCVTGIVVISGLVAWLSGGTQAAPVTVNQITSTEIDKELEVTIAASGLINYQVLNVQINWIVLDILNADLGMPAGSLPLARGPLQKVRVGQPSPNVVRVVLELVRPANFRISIAPDRRTLVVSIPSEPAGGAQGGGDLGVAANRAQPTPAKQAQPTPAKQAQPAPAKQAQPAPAKQAQPTPAKQAQPTPAKQAEPTPIRAIIPGKSIGPVKLGMQIAEVTKMLGPQASSSVLPDGDVVYRWFAPPRNVGLGVRATKTGKIYRIWALNDPKYETTGHLHIGSTEAEVRVLLGTPAKVFTDSSAGVRTLRYDSLGLWIDIQLNKKYTFYNEVFSIGVM